MERKTFLRTAFALAFLKGLADMQGILPAAAKAAPAVPIPESRPGIGGESFKIRLSKSMFHVGDVIYMNAKNVQYSYAVDPAGKHGILTKISGDKSLPNKIIVEFFERREEAVDFGALVAQVGKMEQV